MNLIAITLAAVAFVLAVVALLQAFKVDRRIAQIDASIEHGIKREDLDEIKRELNGLCQLLSALESGFKSQTAQLGRMDTYLRTNHQ